MQHLSEYGFSALILPHCRTKEKRGIALHRQCPVTSRVLCFLFFAFFLVWRLLFFLSAAGIAGNIAVVFQHFLIFRRSKLKGLDGQVEKVAADEIQTDGIIRRAGAGLWDDRSSLMRDSVLRKIDRFQQDA